VPQSNNRLQRLPAEEVDRVCQLFNSIHGDGYRFGSS
jgi:hypothetical protein